MKLFLGDDTQDFDTRWDRQGDGVLKAGPKQAADPRGSRTCVCANPFVTSGGTRRGGRAT